MIHPSSTASTPPPSVSQPQPHSDQQAFAKQVLEAARQIRKTGTAVTHILFLAIEQVHNQDPLLQHNASSAAGGTGEKS